MSLPRGLSYHIISLGCSKNQVDSERINGELSSCGFAPASSPEEADLVIINTCGFIEDAKKESIDVIFDALSLKKRRGKGAGPRSPGRVVVCGCLSERYLDAVKTDIPEVDFCYGIADAGFVPALCRALDIDAGDGAPCRKPLIEALPYRYIKISEGCSNNCSYCAIPSIRGGLNPYPPEAILEDARRAAADGVKEILIIAQDTSAYRYGGLTLSSLADRISGIEGVEWIRLLYCHPDHIDESIIRLLAENEKVVKYIDIPFQHVSERILRSMGRKGSAAVYESLIKTLRDRVPSIRIRSTFMAGYPGETGGEFNELLGFISRTRIDRIGCFTYSREEGTAAADMPGQVPERVKRARYAAIMRAQKKISMEKMDSLIGSTLRVIVEEQADGETWIGRSEYDAPEVDGIFYLTGKGIVINSIVRARVTGSAEYDLFGVLA